MMPEEIKRCKKCKYAKNMSSSDVYCDYFLMTGKRRPCPVKDCTEFVAAKRRPLKPVYPHIGRER